MFEGFSRGKGRRRFQFLAQVGAMLHENEGITATELDLTTIKQPDGYMNNQTDTDESPDTPNAKFPYAQGHCKDCEGDSIPLTSDYVSHNTMDYTTVACHYCGQQHLDGQHDQA